MQQRSFSINLSNGIRNFLIRDKSGIRSITITKIETKLPHDFAFWKNLHLKIVDQKELTLFDQSLSDFFTQGKTTRALWLDKQFGVIDHLSVWVYADPELVFEVEVFYDLHYVSD